MHRIAIACLLFGVACGSPARPAPAIAHDAEPAAGAGDLGLAVEPPAARPILDELNRWCHAQGDECDVSERGRDAYPDRVASGETNGWISSHRDQLRELGVEVVWDVGRRRFVSQVEHDLGLIVGGNFAVDHLGPDLYGAVLERARRRPALYLGVLVETVVGPAPDAGWLSSSHVPHAIELVRDLAPDDAVRVAEALLPHFHDALAVSTPSPAEDESREARLRQRVGQLEALAGR